MSGTAFAIAGSGVLMPVRKVVKLDPDLVLPQQFTAAELQADLYKFALAMSQALRVPAHMLFGLTSDAEFRLVINSKPGLL